MSKHIDVGRRGGGAPIVFKSGEPVSVICAAATFTGVTYANNAGKVQLTSAGVHGLTTSPAVGANVYVSWSGGTGVSGLYAVLSVDDTVKFTINLPYVAGLGTPTVAVANTEIVLASFAIPALTSSSKIRTMWGVVVTPSVNNKNIYAKLNSAALVAQLNSGASSAEFTHNGMISNYGSTNVQRGSWLCHIPGYHTNADFAFGSINTSIPTTLYIIGKPVVSNEIIRLSMCLVEVFI